MDFPINFALIQARIDLIKLLVRDQDVLICVYPRLLLLNLLRESALGLPRSSERQLHMTASMAEGLEILQRQSGSFYIFATEHLSDGIGMELIRQAKVLNPKHRCLLVLTHNHQVLVQQALAAGADAVVLEESLGRTGALIFAMECLSKGQGFVDPAFDGPICTYPVPGELGTSLGTLTPRETQILQLVAEGLSNRAIGEQLHIATSTARDHVRDILRRLGVKSRAAAAVEGLRQGYCR